MIVVVVLAIAASVVALLRWVRIAQREHYIAGSCVRVVGRWARLRPPNGVLVGLTAAGSVAAVIAGLSSSTAFEAVTALVLGAIAAVYPWPPLVLGSPRLRFTRRANTLAALAIVLMAIGVSLLGLVVGWAVAIALVGIAVPAFVDGAAWLATPIERRLLERYRRRAASRLARIDPFVIAVTGSWGKTSTKNHIRDLLVGSAAVVASPASFNNTAGLSRTVNDHLADGTEVLVVEMGMYQPGEIRAMCSWVRPNVAVICSIGPMHLERIGSIERIVAAKAEILERADTAVLWVDDPHLDALSRQATVSKIWRVGSRGGDRLDVEVERGDDGVTVWVDGELIGSCPVQSGIHPGNLGCAVAAALAFGATHRQMRSRLSTLANPPHRSTMQRSDEGVVVIDDTFNSNPAGAAAAIASLARLAVGERVVVTPGMIELGHLQEDANVALGRTIVESGATLVAVGWTNRKALVEGAGGRAVVVADRDAARKWVRDHVREGGGVLWENDLPDHYP